MSVKRVKISLQKVRDKSISIPLRIDSLPTDNTDLIDNDFVLVERRKILNPIIDYEKVRVTPYYLDNSDPVTPVISEVEKIVFNIYFSDGSTWENFYGSDNMGSGTFTDKDLKYRLNRFKNSFLRLRYHSTPNNTAGELVGLQQIYTQLGEDNVWTYNSDSSNLGAAETSIKAKVGKPLPVLSNPAKLVVGNNKKILGIEPDGFFFYWQKRHIPDVIYLSYTFNNAKNGKVSTLTPKVLSSTNKITFSEIHNITFIPIEIKYDGGIYMYIFKPNASHDGISYDKTTKVLTINLYEKKSNI